MQSLAVAFPVLAGKTEDFRRWMREINGPRSGEQASFFRRVGLTRAYGYLQHTPSGDYAIQYSEGEDPAAAYKLFAELTHAFDMWTRAQAAAVYGIDSSRPPAALPELAFDYPPVKQIAVSLRAGR